MEARAGRAFGLGSGINVPHVPSRIVKSGRSGDFMNSFTH